MKVLSLSIAIAALLQPGGSPTTRQTSLGCVRTAPMPIATLSSRDRMPVLRPDTSRLARMPVVLLRPCYLADSTVRRLLP